MSPTTKEKSTTKEKPMTLKTLTHKKDLLSGGHRTYVGARRTTPT